MFQMEGNGAKARIVMSGSGTAETVPSRFKGCNNFLANFFD